MDQQQLREMIDACRPDGGDLHEPELSALADHLAHDEEARQAWEKSRRLDAALAAAFHDAPVPADLEERLLAQFGAASADEQAGQEVVALPPRSRRSLLATLVGGGVAAVLGLMFYLFGTGPEELPGEQLVQESQKWLDALEDDPQRWSGLDESSIQLFPATQVAALPENWRYVSTGFGRKSRVYRLRLPTRQVAYLFVVPTSVKFRGVGGVPPRSSFPQATGGWRIGAWQTDGHLYVLAVEGSESLYRSLIPTRPTA